MHTTTRLPSGVLTKFADSGYTGPTMECAECGERHYVLESCPMCGNGPAPYVGDASEYPLWGNKEAQAAHKAELAAKRRAG